MVYITKVGETDALSNSYYCGSVMLVGFSKVNCNMICVTLAKEKMIFARGVKKFNLKPLLLACAMCLVLYYLFQFTEMVDFKATTCSLRAFKRGMGQKIVAYSFFGGLQSEHAKFRKYFKGIKDNMKLMKLFYPNHVMRVYVDFQSEKSTVSMLKSLEEKNDNIGECCSLEATVLSSHLVPLVSSIMPRNHSDL